MIDAGIVLADRIRIEEDDIYRLPDRERDELEALLLRLGGTEFPSVVVWRVAGPDDPHFVIASLPCITTLRKEPREKYRSAFRDNDRQARLWQTYLLAHAGRGPGWIWEGFL